MKVPKVFAYFKRRHEIPDLLCNLFDPCELVFILVFGGQNILEERNKDQHINNYSYV